MILLKDRDKYSRSFCKFIYFNLLDEVKIISVHI